MQIQRFDTIAEALREATAAARASKPKQIGNKIRIHQGNEGPLHDPYSFTEVTVTNEQGHTATAHLGLGCWVALSALDCDYKIFCYGEDDYKVANEIMRQIVGITADEAQQEDEQRETLLYAMHEEHGEPRIESGFPGETYVICPCGEHLDYHFNRAAVE